MSGSAGRVISNGIPATTCRTERALLTATGGPRRRCFFRRTRRDRAHIRLYQTLVIGSLESPGHGETVPTNNVSQGLGVRGDRCYSARPSRTIPTAPSHAARRPLHAHPKIICKADTESRTQDRYRHPHVATHGVGGSAGRCCGLSGGAAEPSGAPAATASARGGSADGGLRCRVGAVR